MPTWRLDRYGVKLKRETPPGPTIDGGCLNKTYAGMSRLDNWVLNASPSNNSSDQHMMGMRRPRPQNSSE